jgi:hypothetical protein
MSVSPGNLTVTIPEDKIQDLLVNINQVLQSNVVAIRTLRSITGKLSFVAGLVPQLRPFLSPLWAVSANTSTIDGTPTEGSPSAGGRRNNGLPAHLAHVSRVSEALTWARALLLREAGSLTRVHPLGVTPPSEVLCITTDASPWGIGAVLTQEGNPIAWLADELHQEDLDRFNATLGESAFTTTWEALAILVSLRVWRSGFPRNTRFAIRSDSLGALSAIAKMASPSKGLALILKEIALDEAGQTWGFETLTHIPGVSNTLADPLSRLHAPDAKAIPEVLYTVPRTTLERRIGSWWVTDHRYVRFRQPAAPPASAAGHRN